MTIDIIAKAQSELDQRRQDAIREDDAARHHAERAIAARLDVIELERFLVMARRFAADETEPPEGTAPSPAQSQEAGSAEPDASRDTAAGPVCDADPAPHPVAKPEEEANGAIAAASDDPASREADDAERQQLAASGFTGDAAGNPASSETPAATVSPQPELPAETEQAGEGVSVAPADQSPATDKTVEASASAAPLTLKERIIALREEHPDWTLDQATEHLGAARKSVQTYASILGFKWPVTKRFYLRDQHGEYLHRNGTTMTRVPSFYWEGTEADILALKKSNEKARDLTERPVA